MIANNLIHIAFCTDIGYLMPCGISITSICENNKDENILFHIVITKNSTNDIETKVKPLIDIIKKYNKDYKLYTIDESTIASYVCRGSQYISVTAFARIFLPNLLSSEIKKVLYLDGDLVVVGSLRDLWNIDIPEDCPIAGVVDVFGLSSSYRYNVQIPLEIPYINSGVLLMNLDVWRRNDYTSKAMSIAQEHKFPLLDQDTLNYLFRDQIYLLPILYNVQTHYLFNESTKKLLDYRYVDEMQEALNNPIIIHYVSSNKPWINEQCPMREYWEKYYLTSIWKDLPYKETYSCLFEYSNAYKPFINAYWSDSHLMKEALVPFLKVFSAINHFRSKNKILKVFSCVLNSMASVLEFVYRLKK